MRIALSIALLVAVGGVARAHQSSIKYTDVTVEGAGAKVRMTIAPSDVTQPLGMDETAQPTLAQAMAPATLDRVTAFVASWMNLRTPDGAVCAIGSPRAVPAADGTFVEVSWDVTCPGPIDRLVLDFTRFFALDPRHEAIVSVHAPGERVEPIVVRATDPILTVTPGETTSLWGWIRHGMDHIFGGLDHIAFVLALLLVVAIQRIGGEWKLRSPWLAIKSTAIIITAFTVAHSASLIAASLGYVSLPSRFVESMIAASIVYTAIENVIRPDVRWRFALTFAFGLIHGLGFASMLAALLPEDAIVVPLIAFNVGVELGQLGIVVATIPVLWGLARIFGAEKYRRIVVPVAAVPLVLVGIKWLIERVFDLTTFTFLGM
ncbi:MAG: HupE/UreJ family protein [Kofleriaceae bacterium]